MIPRHVHAVVRCVIILAILVIVGGAVVPAAGPAVAASSRSFSCLPGYEYAIESEGKVTQIAPDGTLSSFGSWNVSDPNGLGISAGGDWAYSFQRGWTTSGGNQATILTYDARTQTFTTTSDTYQAPFVGSLIGGALDLDTGDFYFGGFEKSVHSGVNEFRFRIFMYARTSRTFSDRGYVWTSITDAGPTNGDLAFDAAGNMFIVRGSETATNIVIVGASALAASNGGEIPSQSATTFASGLAYTNGLDFDNLGNAYLSNETTIARFDPTTWTRLSTVTTALSGSSDLASCVAPPTLTGTVDISERNAPGDQFAVSIRSGSATSVKNTTAGTATGLQPQVTGPLPVLVDSTYTVVEEASGTTDMNDYRTTWSCRSGSGVRGSGAGTTVLGSGSGTTATVTIPTNPAATDRGVSVVCSFTNVLRPKLTLVKAFDIHHAAPADATVWELTATRSSVVTTFSSGQTKPLDAGSYSLGEVARPGYTLAGTSCSDAAGTAVALGSGNALTIADGQRVTCTLTNEDQAGAVTWRKTDGVSGAIAGGATFTLTPSGGTAVDIVDNVGQTGYSGADSDSRPGVFHVTGLAWGTYALKEASPPDGYRLSSASTSFTIGASTLDASVSDVQNERILSFDVEKYSYSDRGQASPALLDGAAFDLRRDDHGHLGAAVTGVLKTGAQPGRFSLVDIPPGSYWLVETAAPSGYAPLVAPIAFTVRHDATHPEGAIDLASTTDPLVSYDTASRTLRIWDARAVTLPTAGGPGSIVFTAVGVVVLGATALIWARARRRRRRPPSSLEPSLPTPTPIDTQKAEGL